VVQAFCVRDVIQEDCAVCAFAISREQKTEPVLASKVPDLQTRAFVVNEDFFAVKIHPNSKAGVVQENARHVLVCESSLADARVPKEKQFKCKIEERMRQRIDTPLE